MLDDSNNHYAGTTRFLHWSMAILVVLQFLKLGDRIGEGEHWVGQTIVPWHISIGLSILLLAVVRIIWTLRQRQHRPQPEASVLLAKAGHFLLYLSMLLMPVTGILTMLGNGYGLTAFGVDLVAKTGIETPWMMTVGSLHSPISWIFVALVVGHIAAALYHHFVKRDNTLRRMLGR